MPSSGDKVVQRRLRFLVAAGLEAAVGVDPQARDRHGVGGQADELGELLGAGDAGGVDVPHAGADAVVESGLGELGDDLHLGARGLDRRHVGVQALDGVDDLAELGVAQVRVDLGVGAHRGGGQAEGSHGPVQVVGVAVGVQGQELSQGGLVDLDGGDAGGLEIGDLVAQGQADLVGDLAERQVVAGEGPRDDRDGTGEHALDGLVGE